MRPLDSFLLSEAEVVLECFCVKPVFFCALSARDEEFDRLTKLPLESFKATEAVELLDDFRVGVAEVILECFCIKSVFFCALSARDEEFDRLTKLPLESFRDTEAVELLDDFRVGVAEVVFECFCIKSVFFCALSARDEEFDRLTKLPLESFRDTEAVELLDDFRVGVAEVVFECFCIKSVFFCALSARDEEFDRLTKLPLESFRDTEAVELLDDFRVDVAEVVFECFCIKSVFFCVLSARDEEFDRLIKLLLESFRDTEAVELLDDFRVGVAEVVLECFCIKSVFFCALSARDEEFERLIKLPLEFFKATEAVELLDDFRVGVTELVLECFCVKSVFFCALSARDEEFDRLTTRPLESFRATEAVEVFRLGEVFSLGSLKDCFLSLEGGRMFGCNSLSSGGFGCTRDALNTWGCFKLPDERVTEGMLLDRSVFFWDVAEPESDFKFEELLFSVFLSTDELDAPRSGNFSLEI